MSLEMTPDPRPSAAVYRIAGQRAVSRITQFLPPLIGLISSFARTGRPAPSSCTCSIGRRPFVKGGRPFLFLDDVAWR
jgi:hypothetical protein